MKVLDSVIKFGNAFSGLNKVAQTAVVGALLFVAYTMGGSSSENKLDNFLVEYKEVQENAKRTTQFADSLRGEVESLVDSAKKKDETIKKLTISVSFRQESRQTAKDNVERIERRMMMPSPPPASDLVEALKVQVAVTDSIVTEQQQIISVQEEKIDKLNTALTLSMTRGDSLQAILSSLPKAPSNPDKFFFGLLPKPNRKVVGIVAFATGVVIGSKL